MDIRGFFGKWGCLRCLPAWLAGPCLLLGSWAARSRRAPRPRSPNAHVATSTHTLGKARKRPAEEDGGGQKHGGGDTDGANAQRSSKRVPFSDVDGNANHGACVWLAWRRLPAARQLPCVCGILRHSPAA